MTARLCILLLHPRLHSMPRKADCQTSGTPLDYGVIRRLGSGQQTPLSGFPCWVGSWIADQSHRSPTLKSRKTNRRTSSVGARALFIAIHVRATDVFPRA